MPIVVLGCVLLANSIIIDIKQNDKFTKVVVTSFLLIFVYYFFTNLMNTLGSNSKLPPFLSTLITPLLLFVISIAFNRYKILSRKI